MKWFLLILAPVFLLVASPVLAHPGRTDSAGCHTCRTNCPSWDLYYGEYHCHNGGSSTSTKVVAPIIVSTPKPTVKPTPVPTIQPTPTATPEFTLVPTAEPTPTPEVMGIKDTNPTDDLIALALFLGATLLGLKWLGRKAASTDET